MSDGDRFVKLSASALGLGYLPLAPGTWASAGAAAVYLLLGRAGQATALSLVAVLTGVVIGVGLAVYPRAEAIYGKKDAGQFVLDELAGYWLTCLLFQWRGPLPTALAAFVAFRFFDVLKPFPIRRIERIEGALGVMLDDLMAAVYAAAALYVVCYGILDSVPGG